MKSMFVFIVGLLSFLYLLNPTIGLFEFLPDALPIVGNLDEATATALLISALGYFGINIPDFFGKNKK